MTYQFERLHTKLRENAAIREKGDIIAIPWPNLPKFSEEMGGIEKGRYYLVTANSKVGKTQLTDFLFMYEPLQWLAKNPNSTLKPKIFYFPLETSADDKLLIATCHYLFLKTKKIYTPKYLTSIKEKKFPTVKELEILDLVIPELRFLEDHVTFVDRIRNPYGIYKYMREYAAANGHYVYKENEFWTDDKGVKHPVINYYVPNDPNELVIIIIDHIGLLTPEISKTLNGPSPTPTLHSAIDKFSNEYALTMRDLWKYTPVIVQQQAADSEKPQFTNRGESIIAKLRPSTDGLGDNKKTQRDVDIMFGLFAPSRYDISEYHGYNINAFKDHYRELMIVMNRRGYGNMYDDLFFHGAMNYFRELPKATDPEMEAVFMFLQKTKSSN